MGIFKQFWVTVQMYDVVHFIKQLILVLGYVHSFISQDLTSLHPTFLV